MILTVGDVLDRAGLDQVRQAAPDLTWRDGRATAGRRAKRVKRNEQADLSTKAGAALHALLLAAIEGNAVIRAAARPKRCSRLLLSRAGKGGGYGAHIDNAVMGHGAGRMRSDVSFTLFLSEPDAYDGGELVIDHPGGEQAIKPPAGDLVLYPSTSIHRVNPIAAGERLVCVGWIESLIRDPCRRELLFDLDNVRTDLRAKLPPDGPELLTLDKTVSNLLRLWVET